MRKLFHRALAVVLCMSLLNNVSLTAFASELHMAREGSVQTVSDNDSVSGGDVIELKDLAVPMTLENRLMMLADGQDMTVTVEHYLGSVADENMVFAPTTITGVDSGDVIENVTRVTNGFEVQSVTVYDIWDGEKVGGKVVTVDADNELMVTSTGSEMVVEVVYKETTGIYVNGTSMFDYGAGDADDTDSINYKGNYPKGSKYSNRLGTIEALNDYKLVVEQSNGEETKKFNANAYWRGKNGNEGWTWDLKKFPILQGLLNSVEDNGYGDAKFNYDEPGFFSDEAKNGKSILDGYELKFNRTGMEYSLVEVLKDGNMVENDMTRFFPLGDNNFYFGVRYDFTFSLGDYIGDLMYSFVGDDDLWVCLDGNVILDLGGIHGAYPNPNGEYSGVTYAPGEVDLWTKILNEADYDLEDKIAYVSDAANANEVHRITVLYMERGANQSNCHMTFVMPNVVAAPPVVSSTASLSLHKIDTDTQEALSEVEFSLTSGDTTLTAKTDEAGNVTFYGLEKGTYTLKETAAKEGYLASDEEWTITVLESKEGNKVTPYIASITPALESANGYYVIENQAAWADLEFAKVDSVTKLGLSGAEFTLTDEDGNVLTAVSENGKVKFEKLSIGEYTLTETVVPDGYAATSDSWKVKVFQNEEGEVCAKLYEGTTEITEIENVYIQVEITQDKTASVKDYENRVYTLDLTAAANAVTVKEADPIDLILSIDVSRSMLYPDKITDGTVAKLENLDKSEYYYYIKDAGSWDCVFVCWYAENAWHEMDTSAWDYAQNANGNATSSNYANASESRTYYLSADYTGVLKSSGSNQNNPYDRMDKMKAAVADFVSNVATYSPESRIGIVTFGGDNSACNREVRALTELTAANVEAIKNQISSLEVSPVGGTYTNYGLEKAKSMAASSDKAVEDKYVLFITDGIPNFVVNGTAYKGENSIDMVASIAGGVAKEAQVMALGISLDRVSYANDLMKAIASDDENYIYQIDDAESLKKAFKSILADIVVGRDVNVNVVDYIDPRFVPVDAAGNIPETITDTEGNTGFVTCENGVYKVVWYNVNISGGWEARFDVKAKPDFMGGNTILTNGSASGIYDVETGELLKDFDDPTVNVKTLEIAAGSKEIEVFKGEELTQDVYLSWLLENISLAAQELEFTDITTVKYSYPGTDDIVGEFTFEKSSETDKDWNEEKAYETEVYKLKVTYTPYTVAERGIRGDAPVGAEAEAVSAEGTYTVNVVEGSISITKEISASDYDASQGDPVFTFKIMKDGEFFAYETVRFTGNGTVKSVALNGLGKGTYTVEELGAIRFECDSVAANGVGEYAADASVEAVTKVATIIIGYDEKGNASKRDAEVELVNKKNNDDNFSDTDVVVNTCSFDKDGKLVWTGNDLTGN